MEKCCYKSLEELPAIMCADDVKDVLGISISSTYELMKEKDFPSFKIGRRVTNKEKLKSYGIVKPELSSDTYSYLRQAAEAGMDVAEYEYSKYLKDKNPELSREYLKRSAERGFTAAMYAYGKLLLEEGREQEALSWVEGAAERDTWARTQLGLLYLYRFNNFEKFKEHIESAANEGDSYAKAAIKHYNSNRNYQIVMGIANLFYYASRIFEDDAAEQDEHMKPGEIDSKLRREIRQKREAQGLHW